jgi:hypothetical protein
VAPIREQPGLHQSIYGATKRPLHVEESLEVRFGTAFLG